MNYFESKLRFSDVGIQIEILVSIIYNFVLKDGDSAIDGGANSGLHSLPMAEIVKNGRLYCFEPEPLTYRGLLANLKASGYLNHSDIYNVAIGDVNLDGISFTTYEGKGANNHVAKTQKKHKDIGVNVEEIYVPMKKLDTLLPDENKLKFIKFDLEGYDFNALKGGVELIKRNRPVIVFEFSPLLFISKSNFVEKKEFYDFFNDMSYDVYDLNGTKFIEKSVELGTLGYEHIAIPREFQRSNDILELINRYWETADTRQTVMEWNMCKYFCKNPAEYYDITSL